MPVGSGTSVEGFQRIVDNTERELELLALNVEAGLNEPPFSVGYFYVQLFVNNNDPQLMYAKGLLYSGGQVIMLPDIATSELKNLNVWINWKQSGINWSAFF